MLQSLESHYEICFSQRRQWNFRPVYIQYVNVIVTVTGSTNYHSKPAQTQF